jgi:hypothetical protein
MLGDTPERRSAPELEYMSLREEALRRVESRNTLLSVTLTLAAAFLGVGWGTGGAVALMLFPPIAALIAAVWVQNELFILNINEYIRNVLEPRLPGLHWESYRRETAKRRGVFHFPVDIMSIGGVFLLSQFLAVFLSVFRIDGSDPVQVILFAINILSIFALVLMVNVLRRASAR